ncbi:MAG: hypothetical protein IPG71_11185 [bacterium]|nr:hypothetical protein [bacterium]
MATNKWLLTLVVAALLIVGVLAARKFWGKEPPDIDAVLQDQVTLAGQDLKFLSRGAKYAHFEMAAFGSEGDTVRSHMRQPANFRKLKALVWVYSSEKGIDARALLDQVKFADRVLILGFNLRSAYPHDDKGQRNPSSADAEQALVQTKRGVELLVQYLKKHQVVDSMQIYLAGQGEGAAAVLAAAAELSGRVAGVGLIDVDRILVDAQEGRTSALTDLRNWARLVNVPRVGVIETQHRMSAGAQASGLEFGVKTERLSMGAVLEQNELAMLGHGVTSRSLDSG